MSSVEDVQLADGVVEMLNGDSYSSSNYFDYQLEKGEQLFVGSTTNLVICSTALGASVKTMEDGCFSKCSHAETIKQILIRPSRAHRFGCFSLEGFAPLVARSFPNLKSLEINDCNMRKLELKDFPQLKDDALVGGPT